MAEPAFDEPGEAPESRFSPRRLRARTLRGEIEATRAELAATIEALERRNAQEVDGEVVRLELVEEPPPEEYEPEPVIDATVEDLPAPAALEEASAPAVPEESPTDDAVEEQPPAPAVLEEPPVAAAPPQTAAAGPAHPAEASRPLRAAAMTLAVGIGAGLILRRRH